MPSKTLAETFRFVSADHQLGASGLEGVSDET